MYIKNQPKFEVGKWYYTEHKHSSLSGTFTRGSYIKIVGQSSRGYDIEDEDGNRITEIGWSV